MSDYRLMIAGPVDSEDDVIDALAAPTLPHYGPLWMPLFDETSTLLQQLFQTQNAVLMMPGPGTGAIEAAISSLVPPGHGICIVSNGHFGMRLGRIVNSYGLNPLMIEFPLGTPANPDEVRQHLKHWVIQAERIQKPIEALVVVHHETSAGVLNPLQELAKVAHEFNLAVIVDAVSSMGGTQVCVDDWGIDACVSVPNKCIGAMAGVALMSVSERAWQMAERNKSHHGWYYNLNTWRHYREAWATWHPYPTTLPTSVIAALHQALIDIFAVGLDQWIASHVTASQNVREGMTAMGFDLFPDPAYAASMVSAFSTRADVDPTAMGRVLLNEYGVVISGALDELYGKVFRVGHMGRARSEDYQQAFLRAIHAYLESEGLPVMVGQH